MNRLIEDYLRARGVRYFRGHHDDEYFFLVDFVAEAYRGRLNVHLEASGADRDSVQVSVSPDRYYPAGRREVLAGVADRWNAEARVVRSVILDSSDPHLVGVLARAEQRPGGPAEFADFVEAAVSGAVELFGLMTAVVAPAQQAPGALRDAG
ncbi:MAG: hypothetical protein ACKOQ4_09325 [Mycobacterium sp.]